MSGGGGQTSGAGGSGSSGGVDCFGGEVYGEAGWEWSGIRSG